MVNSSLLFVLLGVAVAASHALHTQPSKRHCTSDHGFDISSPVSVRQFQCLKQKGYGFVIIRAYRSIGEVDPNVLRNIANARTAGFKDVDIYMFPCPLCSVRDQNPISAAQQVNDMVSALGSSNYQRIWIDVEMEPLWLDNHADNQQFLEKLLKTSKGHKTSGVYASKSQWSAIMGNTYSFPGSTENKELLLWYPDYDGIPSFTGFMPFGGWTNMHIFMKQYRQNVNVCGVNINQNYRK